MVEKYFIIGLAVAIIFGGGFLFKLGFSMEVKKEPPPGYALICNENGKYKWRSSGWTQGSSTTRQQAINAAWSKYKEGDFIGCE